MATEQVDTVMIGGGQAGLAAAYYLRKQGASFVILDANERIGDTWRHRYDSLRLFTPARASHLPGARLPLKGSALPTKDELADYLAAYAARFELPVRAGIRVDRLWREDGRYVLSAGPHRFEAASVIVATGSERVPRIPAFSRDLDPAIFQLHSSEYRNPSQLREGGVLVVGAGNSGGDISVEVVRSHPTWLSGPDRGHVPFDIDAPFARHVASRLVVFVGRHVLTQRTPIGRRMRSKPTKGDPLVRVTPKQIVAAGIHRVPRTVAARAGAPVLENGTVLQEVTNVIWCTGYGQDLSWIDLPIFGEDGAPMHRRGIVTSEPGLAFVGQPWQFALASEVLPGVSRDARYVVRHLAPLRAEAAVVGGATLQRL